MFHWICLLAIFVELKSFCFDLWGGIERKKRVSKIHRQPFWLTTQLCAQNDWLGSHFTSTNYVHRLHWFVLVLSNFFFLLAQAPKIAHTFPHPTDRSQLRHFSFRIGGSTPTVCGMRCHSIVACCGKEQDPFRWISEFSCPMSHSFLTWHWRAVFSTSSWSVGRGETQLNSLSLFHFSSSSSSSSFV